ncbi:RNA 2',3'-cyclic phosphodiesterase [Bacillus sp. 1P06AnD]|uniref:RNA 2',3'-cyclic phosphodiesterase n=1 Tax=Bacillus sp. 1P06AnD TaxID=3132208 RepID=UPI0039A2A6E3
MSVPHYFIALALPDEAKAFLHSRSGLLKESFSFRKWVAEEDYHITLSFLGASDTNKWQACMGKVAQAVKHMQPFTVHVSSINTFGRAEQPRILWYEPEIVPSIYPIQKQITDICIENGFHVSTKPYTPHITLAKNYKGEIPFGSSQRKEWDDILGRGITFIADRISIYRIELGRIPRYEEVMGLALGPNQ